MATKETVTRSSMELAKKIDHTLLKPEATVEDYNRLCQEAIDHGFWSVCLPPAYVALAKEQLRSSEVKVCTVVGFPLGYSLLKAEEARRAVKDGADEIDMVLNISYLKSGLYAEAEKDIRAVVDASDKRLVKVILETCLLSSEEIIKACQLAKSGGAHFVKTSTGFSLSGASENAVRLMRETVGPDMGVKASGGIRDSETAWRMIKVGATRLGTSSGISIVSGGEAQQGTY